MVNRLDNMAKSNTERSADRDKRNRDAGLYRTNAWMPASRKLEFLAMVKLWMDEHVAAMKEDCNHDKQL